MAPITGPTEAVIISGPRRGEIIRLPHEAGAEFSAEDLRMLDEALDGLLAAFDRLSHEVRAATSALRVEVDDA